MVDEAEPAKRARRAAGTARRSPSDAERRRDPGRTREKILEAALVEFGEHGFAGARISAIAARAGVNQQLISYYFDGKEGLYRALSERWRAMSAQINHAGASLAEIVNGFVQVGAHQRHWARLLIWESLEGRPDPDSGGFHAGLVADVRRRQQAGELAAELDPAYVLLVLFGAALAPIALPQVARSMTGQAPDSPAFVAGYREQLGLVVALLQGARAPEPERDAAG